MAYALLLFVPLSLALRYLVDAPPGWVCCVSACKFDPLSRGIGVQN
jgi:hypothetical protein